MQSTFTADRRLAPCEAEALWRRWHDGRDKRARDRLVLAYAPMVRYVAGRKARELPSHCELEDLASCGIVALMEAVDRFDPAKGATFEQYTWTRVVGAIADELRRQDWASRSVRRFGRRAERTRGEWTARNGAAPSETELAQALQVDVSVLRTGLADVDRAELASLSAPVRSGSDEPSSTELGDTIGSVSGADEPEHATLSSERREIFSSAVAKLSERERSVLALVHVHELRGDDVGRLLGVSESRVSQILTGMRRKLKDELEAYDSAPRSVAV